MKTKRKRNRVEILPAFPSGSYRLEVNGECWGNVTYCRVAGGYVCHDTEGRAFGSLEKLRQAVLKDLRR